MTPKTLKSETSFCSCTLNLESTNTVFRILIFWVTLVSKIFWPWSLTYVKFFFANFAHFLTLNCKLILMDHLWSKIISSFPASNFTGLLMGKFHVCERMRSNLLRTFTAILNLKGHFGRENFQKKNFKKFLFKFCISHFFSYANLIVGLKVDFTLGYDPPHSLCNVVVFWKNNFVSITA